MSLPSVSNVCHSWVEKVSLQQGIGRQAAMELVCCEVPLCYELMEFDNLLNRLPVNPRPFKDIINGIMFHAGASGCKEDRDIQAILNAGVKEGTLPVLPGQDFARCIECVKKLFQQIINVKKVQNQYNITSEVKECARELVQAKLFAGTPNLSYQEGACGDIQHQVRAADVSQMSLEQVRQLNREQRRQLNLEQMRQMHLVDPEQRGRNADEHGAMGGNADNI